MKSNKEVLLKKINKAKLTKQELNDIIKKIEEIIEKRGSIYGRKY